MTIKFDYISRIFVEEDKVRFFFASEMSRIWRFPLKFHIFKASEATKKPLSERLFDL